MDELKNGWMNQRMDGESKNTILKFELKARGERSWPRR